MKYWIQQLWMQRILKKIAPDHNRVQSSFNKVKRVGLLVTGITPDLQLEVITALQQLFGSGIALVCIQYVNKKSTTEMDVIQISASDFSLSGRLENEQLKATVAEPFDLVIHYHQSNNPFVDWLGLQLKAPLRVGFKEVQRNLSNLVIDVPIASVDLFVQELDKYITILKTK